MSFATQDDTQPARSPRTKGRPRKGEDVRIRTIAWYHAALRAAGVENATAMARRFDDDLVRHDPRGKYASTKESGKWKRYRDGSNVPSRQTLFFVQRLYPDVVGIFEIGPEGKPLWKAMWKPEPELPSLLIELYPLNDLKAVLEYYGPWTVAAGVLRQAKDLLHQGTIEDSVGLLTALIASYRLLRIRAGVERGFFVGSSLSFLMIKEVLKLKSCISKLDEFGIHQEIVRWIENEERQRLNEPTTFRDGFLKFWKTSLRRSAIEIYSKMPYRFVAVLTNSRRQTAVDAKDIYAKHLAHVEKFWRSRIEPVNPPYVWQDEDGKVHEIHYTREGGVPFLCEGVVPPMPPDLTGFGELFGEQSSRGLSPDWADAA